MVYSIIADCEVPLCSVNQIVPALPVGMGDGEGAVEGGASSFWDALLYLWM